MTRYVSFFLSVRLGRADKNKRLKEKMLISTIVISYIALDEIFDLSLFLRVSLPTLASITLFNNVFFSCAKFYVGPVMFTVCIL